MLPVNTSKLFQWCVLMVMGMMGGSASAARAATYTGNAVFARNGSGGCDRIATDYGADFNNPHNWDSGPCTDDGVVPGDTAVIPAGFNVTATAPVSLGSLILVDATATRSGDNASFPQGATITTVSTLGITSGAYFTGPTSIGTVNNHGGVQFNSDATVHNLNLYGGAILVVRFRNSCRVR